MRAALVGMLLAAACAIAGSAGAQSAPDFVWVQWAADGKPHVRAIVANGPCPSLAAGATVTPLNVRAMPGGAFPDTVCDLVLPAGARGAKVGAQQLPPIPRSPRKIAVFGDTGCRIDKNVAQPCDDRTAWPFPAVARDVAADRPDLVLHVGDYYYRELACPAGANCTNSPHGDNAAAWVADYFAPAKPLFAAAPVINVRGNHEQCDRGGTGWSRYLSGLTEVGCTPHEPVTLVTFDNLLIGDVDDAYMDDKDAAPANFLADEHLVDAAATPARETWLATHRPPIAYEAKHQTDETNGTHLAAIVSGHIHIFAAIAFPFAKEPPQMIVGTGGDVLAPQSDVQLVSEAVGGLIERRFGYAIFERARDGWTVSVHDTDGTLHRRCTLAARNVTCTRVLNAPAESPAP